MGNELPVQVRHPSKVAMKHLTSDVKIPRDSEIIEAAQPNMAVPMSPNSEQVEAGGRLGRYKNLPPWHSSPSPHTLHATYLNETDGLVPLALSMVLTLPFCLKSPLSVVTRGPDRPAPQDGVVQASPRGDV